MEKLRAFLKRKDIVFSAKRYFIDAMGAMAQGLFCTLLVGTILNTIGQQFHIGVLNAVIVTIGTGDGAVNYTIGGLCSAMVGPGMAVAIARALINRPQIILADEPVAALDPVTARQVMQDFVRINKEMGISILLNIHHVELALEYADRIIGIRAGKIVYDGPSANVDQSVLDAIYGDDSETEADA